MPTTSYPLQGAPQASQAVWQCLSDVLTLATSISIIIFYFYQCCSSFRYLLADKTYNLDKTLAIIGEGRWVGAMRVEYSRLGQRLHIHNTARNTTQAAGARQPQAPAARGIPTNCLWWTGTSDHYIQFILQIFIVVSWINFDWIFIIVNQLTE